MKVTFHAKEHLAKEFQGSQNLPSLPGCENDPELD